MNRALIRGLCCLVLLASVVVRFQTNKTRLATMTDFDVGAAVTGVIRQHGYALRENPVKPPSLLAGVIYFQRPECEQVSLVLPHFINEETQTLLMRVAKPGSDRHFYYLDGSWNDQARVAMFLEWAKFAVLDIFGFSQYIPVKKAIVLADAPGCHPAATIDWRPVWEKHSQSRAAESGSGSPGT
jgi:hypothetical protein